MKDDNSTNASFEWLRPSRNGRPSGKREGARVALYAAGKAKPQISIAIYKDTMKKLRWVVGDRVEVGIDYRSNCIALRRVPAGGYALTALTFSSGQKRVDAIGKPLASVTKLSAPDEFISVFRGRVDLAPDDCLEIDGMLVLSLDGAKVAS